MELLATNNLAIDDAVYEDLIQRFSAPEIVALGMYAALCVGFGLFAAACTIDEDLSGGIRNLAETSSPLDQEWTEVG